jgi:hypothetical protein
MAESIGSSQWRPGDLFIEAELPGDEVPDGARGSPTMERSRSTVSSAGTGSRVEQVAWHSGLPFGSADLISNTFSP